MPSKCNCNALTSSRYVRVIQSTSRLHNVLHSSSGLQAMLSVQPTLYFANFSGTDSASEYNLKCTTRFVQCHLHSYTTDVYTVHVHESKCGSIFHPALEPNFFGFHYGSSSAGQLCDHQFSVFGVFLRVKTVLLQTIGTGAA